MGHIRLPGRPLTGEFHHMTASSHADALVILLHGVGGDGQNMLGLAEAWRPSLESIAFTAPDGPFAFDHGPAGNGSTSRA